MAPRYSRPPTSSEDDVAPVIPAADLKPNPPGALREPTDLMSTVVDGNLITAAEWTGQPGMLATFALAVGFTIGYQRCH
jgi:hypothetical protein